MIRVHLRLPGRQDESRLDTTASRFAPESVAGLIVRAWGLFIFALHPAVNAV